MLRYYAFGFSRSRSSPAASADDPPRQLMKQSERFGELFAVQNEVLLYGVTSTYFRRRSVSEPTGKARLFTRSSPRLQTGVHRPTNAQIRLRSVTHPDPAQATLLDRLG